MSSQRTSNSIVGKSSTISQSAPADNFHELVHLKSLDGKFIDLLPQTLYIDSDSDSFCRVKRQQDMRQYMVGIKRRKNGNNLMIDPTGLMGDSYEPDLHALRRYDNSDIMASQESQRTSQQSIIEVGNHCDRDDFSDSGDDDILDSQSDVIITGTSFPVKNDDVKSKRLRQANGSTTETKEPQQSRSTSDIEISMIKSVIEKKKASNRKYAQDSRNRQKDKLKNLQEKNTEQDCLIEIYKKTITIYHKRLMSGNIPVWSESELTWYPGNSGGSNCQTVKCFLPVLDDNYLEELGNGPYGKIVSNGGFKKQCASPSIYSDEKSNHGFISNSKTRVDLSYANPDIDLGKRSRISTSFSSAESSSSGSVSENYSQTAVAKPAEIVLPIIISTPNTDMFDNSQVRSHPTGEFTNTLELRDISFLKNANGTCDGSFPEDVSKNCAVHFLADHSLPSNVSPTTTGFPMSYPTCGSVRLTEEPTTCFIKKTQEFGSSLPENAAKDPLSNLNHEANTFLHVTSRDSNLHVSSQIEQDTSENMPSSSYQDTIDQDSDDIDNLQASLETV